MTDDPSQLQLAVNAALSVASWRDSMEGIKLAVASAVEAVDKDVSVKDTAYFNHSFIPDFRLTWPGPQKRSRDVFLRLDSSGDSLEEDLEVLGDDSPILLSIVPLATQGTVSSDPVLAQSDALVTEPDALSQLRADDRVEFGRVLPSALLRGGRGVVDSDAADTLNGMAQSFFVGSREHDPAVLASASSTLERALSRGEAERIHNFGRIIWEATGGDPQQFPIPTSLEGIDDNALRFVLDDGPDGGPEFWRSIGEQITIERLVRLSPRTSDNLRALITANLDRLTARAVMVKAAPKEPRRHITPWTVAAGSLVLRGLDFEAYLAAKRGDISASPDEAGAVDLPTFRRRVGGTTVDSVTLSAGDGTTVTVESTADVDLVDGDVLHSLEQVQRAQVLRVGLTVGTKSLSCRFDSRTASGNTNTSFSAAELLTTAVPVLWPVQAADERMMQDIVALNATAAGSSAPGSEIPVAIDETMSSSELVEGSAENENLDG